MNEDSDRDLPLHAEAKARADWRGGETILARGRKQGGLPASEVDDAASAGAGDAAASGDAPRAAAVPPPD